MIAILESVRFMRPDYPFETIDIVTERTNMLRLLGWIGGKKDPFRIDIERAGDHSILLTRWDHKLMEHGSGTYGLAWKLKTTTARDPHFREHNRSVSYVRCHLFGFPRLSLISDH